MEGREPEVEEDLKTGWVTVQGKRECQVETETEEMETPQARRNLDPLPSLPPRVPEWSKCWWEGAEGSKCWWERGRQQEPGGGEVCGVEPEEILYSRIIYIVFYLFKNIYHNHKKTKNKCQQKTNDNKKQMSTKNKCQQKTNVNQKQMSTKNTQLNPTEPNITQPI